MLIGEGSFSASLPVEVELFIVVPGLPKSVSRVSHPDPVVSASGLLLLLLTRSARLRSEEGSWHSEWWQQWSVAAVR